MKNCRKTTAALLLALALSTSAFAGEMHTDRTPPPPPTTTGIVVAEETDGEMHTGETATAPEATDTVTEIALTLLQSVLSLF